MEKAFFISAFIFFKRSSCAASRSFVFFKRKENKSTWKQIREEGEAIYRDKVKSVIFDDKITGEEQEELDSLQKEFDISDYDSGRIRSSEVNEKI